MIGGDLYRHINSRHYFKEIEAKFIIASILYGLTSFHKRNLVYGDLKPENILINEEGYTHLTDFGFCRYRTGEGIDLY